MKRGERRTAAELRRIDKLFERHTDEPRRCAFCENERGIYQLSAAEAEGLPSNCLCPECFVVWNEVEDALSQLMAGIRGRIPSLATKAFRAIIRREGKVTLTQLRRAIDLARENEEEKGRLLHRKDMLTGMLLRAYGDKLQCVVRYDTKFNMTRVTWCSDGHKWSCHIPESYLRGRFREMSLATH